MKLLVRLLPNKATRNLRTIDLFPALCIVNADVSEFKQSIQPQINRSSGLFFYRLEYDVIVLFGRTELKAQLAWKENVGSTSLASRFISNAHSRELKSGMIPLTSWYHILIGASGDQHPLSMT